MYAYDKCYLERARTLLGVMLDFGVNRLGLEAREFWKHFLISKISERFENGDTGVLAGKSGIELVNEVMGDDSLIRSVPIVQEEKSPEYWAGWALAYYQWESEFSFREIEEAVPIQEVVAMYFPYHEMDISHFCNRMNERISQSRKEKRLKVFRTRLGLSQSQLAKETGIPLRTIQQYEQGQKNINGARSEYLLAFSKALYCRPEELVEK